MIKDYDLYEAILKHSQGKNVDLDAMKAAIACHQGLVCGRAGEVTTLEHFKRELEMILWAEEGKGRGRALSSAGISDRLNPSQRKAVEQLLECQDQFSVLYGVVSPNRRYSVNGITAVWAYNPGMRSSPRILSPEKNSSY